MTLKELCVVLDFTVTLGHDFKQQVMADFKPMVEVIDGGMLISTCGRGVDVNSAIADLCDQVSNKRIRISRGEPAERRQLPTITLK